MDLSTIHHGIKRRTRKKRVGRGPGSGHGKTSSRGAKGQYASAGAGVPRWTFEGGQMPLFRRIPKRGFNHRYWDLQCQIINVGDLDVFADGDNVDLNILKEKGLIKGAAEGLRILGDGELTKRLTVKANHFSKSAAEKITSRGGTTEKIPPPKKPKRGKMKTRNTEG